MWSGSDCFVFMHALEEWVETECFVWQKWLYVCFWADCWSVCGRLTVNSFTVQDRRGQDEHVEVVLNTFWVRLESADTNRWAQGVRWRSQSHLSNTDRHGHKILAAEYRDGRGTGGVRNKISCVSMHTLRMSDMGRPNWNTSRKETVTLYYLCIFFGKIY